MENKTFNNNLFFIIIISLVISIYTASEPLTPLEVQEFDKMSSPILFPDGKYVIYTKVDRIYSINHISIFNLPNYLLKKEVL